MEFLNANSTECSVVLFFTAWCQFSARLAPHFNALPRVFPSMHFLALDASQHSRLLVIFLVLVIVISPSVKAHRTLIYFMTCVSGNITLYVVDIVLSLNH